MDKNLKELAKKSINKTLEINTISKEQKIQIFQNQMEKLHDESHDLTEKVRNNQIEIRLLQTEIRKLSNKGWNKYQS